MPEKRLISFLSLTNVCHNVSWKNGRYFCCKIEKACNAKNCPIWRRAERERGER